MTTKELRLAAAYRRDSRVGHLALLVAAVLLILGSTSFGVLYERSVSDGVAIEGLKSGFDNTRSLLDQLCNKGANTDSAQCKQAATQPDTAAKVAKDGSAGTNGRDGLPGVDGVSIRGPIGLTGATGAIGVRGLIGVSTNGTNGTNGDSGAKGVDGTNGVDGAAGTNGTNGVDGKNGTGIRSITCGLSGDWTVSYDDGTSSTVSGPCRLITLPTSSPSGHP